MAGSPKRSTIAGILVIIWLAGTVIFYYVSHKPLSPQVAGLLASAIVQFVAALAIVSIAGGTGAHWPKVGDLHPLAGLALQAAFGLGIISLLIFGVGLLLGFGVWQSWGLMLILATVQWRSIQRWYGGWRAMGQLWAERGILVRAFAVGSGLIALVTLGVALAPPVKFDALVYHLALPRYYLDTGEITPWSGAWFWGMPQSGEMLYTWAMALAGEGAAACLGWLTGMLALLGLWGLTRQALNQRSAWIAVAVMLSGDTLSAGLAHVYVDWLAILYGVAGLLMLVAWLKDGEAGKLALLGVFCGMAIGVKYTSGALLLAALAAVLWHNGVHRNPLKRFVWDLLICLLPAFLLSTPWLLKNLLFTGNPIYPFLFPTEHVTLFRQSFYQLSTWGDWRDVLFLPWRATMSGIEGTPGYSATIGPLFLALAPLVFVKWKRYTWLQRQSLTAGALVGFAGLFVWAIASRFSGLLVQSRLYFAVFPALAFLAGGGFFALERINWPGVRLSRVAGALLLLVYAFSAFQLVVRSVEKGVLPVLLGGTTKESYLDGNLGWYAPTVRGVTELEPGSKVLMLWEPRGYGCLPACIPDEVLDRWISDRHEYGNAESIATHWREEGFTHVLYNRFGADFVREQDQRYLTDDWQALDRLLSSLEIEENFGDAYRLYRLGP